MEISDDDDTRAMLEISTVEHTIEFYAEKDTMSHRLPESHEKFTRMLDMDNESTSFMPSVHNA